MRSQHSLISFTSHLSLFLLLFFISSSTFPLLSSSSSTTLIQETCKECSETDPNLSYDFCAASLESSPDSRRCSDLRQLGLLAIRLTKQNVTGTRRFIKQLLSKKNSRKLDPNVRPRLNDCMELYSDAIPTIKDATKNYKLKRYDDANIALSSVLDASTTCEDGFNEKENIVSPLTKRNKDTFQLSAISLSIINMVNIKVKF